MRAELGGLERLAALLDACAELHLGALVDHVPNHMSVGRPELNQPWWAMLRDGPRTARRRPGSTSSGTAAAGKVNSLPVLGEPLGRRRRPLRADGRGAAPRAPALAAGPGDRELPTGEALGRQHYRLQWWREPAHNVRRFFTIDGLVGVSRRDPAVAAVVDTVPRSRRS